MRLVLVGLLAASVAMAGCIQLPFGLGGDDAQALATRQYTRDVGVAVNSLSLVFGQADESVKAFQNGWLAPEGAASQFGFLHEQVKHIKGDFAKAEPPQDMVGFHRQLGRSVSLTQQAMDAMQEGFASGDESYFELAGQKLAEARKVLGKASEEI